MDSRISAQNDDFSDPDKIVVLGEDEEYERQLSRPVYRPCCVPFDGRNTGGDDGTEGVDVVRSSMQTAREQLQDLRGANKKSGKSSRWSLTRFVNDHLVPSCCSRTSTNDANLDGSESKIELHNLVESPSQVLSSIEEVPSPFDPITRNLIEDRLKSQKASSSEPEIDAVTAAELASPYSHRSQPSEIGPVWVVDRESPALDTTLALLKSSGDRDVKVRTLVVHDPPLDYAMKVLQEPLLSENVNTLHLVNCEMSVSDVCTFLVKLENLEDLSIILNKTENVIAAPHKYLLNDFRESCTQGSYYDKIRYRLENMTSHPQRLKNLTVSLPLIWQCSLVCQSLEALLPNAQLQTLNISSCLQDVLIFLLSFEGINFEQEKTWQDFVTLKCKGLLLKSCNSLKQFSLACADKFPLEHWKLSKNDTARLDEILRWCFYITCGILDGLRDTVCSQEGCETSISLPTLRSVSLNLPFIPVPMIKDEFFSAPLHLTTSFLAKNYHLQQVELFGLRPEKGMENWIKHSLITIPKSTVRIGATYSSTSLSVNLPVYDDELASVGFTIVPEESRQTISEIIEPLGKDTHGRAWRYTGTRCLHVINELPSLASFDLDRITFKFHRLSTLVLEDYTMRYDTNNCIVGGGETAGEAGGSRKRSLTDADIQSIFKNLSSIQHLHLDCDMTRVTDFGLTGIADSLWSRLTQRSHVYSFWYLFKLKYVYMRGFGLKVTDKSAVYAFSEEYSMKNLQELHVFSPGFTNFGKDKIRRAFGERGGFILNV